EEYLAQDEGPSLAVTIFDLVKTFQNVLDRAKSRPTFSIDREDVSVPDMIRFLRHQLERGRKQGPVSATALFESQHSRRAMICLFLAILELVKQQAVELTQGEAFGDIGLHRGPGFESPMPSPEELAALEEEYQ
ncbi:MAG: segregation/condensation protein A, partial [Bryobacteraceae bacterium]